MIPSEHVMLLALIQFLMGLAGFILRRAGITLLMAAVLMLSGILLAFASLPAPVDGSTANFWEMTLLILMVVLVVIGVAILYSFDRFRKSLNVEEQNRMQH